MPTLSTPRIQGATDGTSSIRGHGVAPPLPIPRGHIGPIELPGTGRMVWWTGRVAIGLRHQPTRHFGPITQSGQWIQSLLLNRKSGGLVPA